MAEKRMQIEEFLSKYFKAHEQGLTRDEFAESVGVKSVTVYQRVHDLRKAGLDLPSLAPAGRTSMIERAKAYVRGRVTTKAPKSQRKKDEEQPDPLAELLG